MRQLGRRDDGLWWRQLQEQLARGWNMDDRSSQSRTDAIETAQYDELTRLRQLLDLAPNGLMFCDEALVIRYLNRAAMETLRRLEQYLPCRACELIGKSVDLFHRPGAGDHRRALDRAVGRRHRMKIQLGAESFMLSATAVTGAWGINQGYAVAWMPVTDHEKNAEASRVLRQAVESAPLDPLRVDRVLRRFKVNCETLRALLDAAVVVNQRLEELIDARSDSSRAVEWTSSQMGRRARDVGRELTALREQVAQLTPDVDDALSAVTKGVALVSQLREDVRRTARVHAASAERATGSAPVGIVSVSDLATQAQRLAQQTSAAAAGRLSDADRRTAVRDHDALLARLRATDAGGDESD